MIELILHEPLTDESHASESELSGVRSKKPVEKDLALVTLAAVLLCFEMAPAENNLAALLLVCVPALWFSIKLDLDIRGRNCDRTVERSPALEGLDELDALLLRDPLEVKVQPHRIEQAHLGPNPFAGIEHCTNSDCGRLQRHLLCPGQDLHEFDATGGDT
jgi:hypothetical protein